MEQAPVYGIRRQGRSLEATFGCGKHESFSCNPCLWTTYDSLNVPTVHAKDASWYDISKEVAYQEAKQRLFQSYVILHVANGKLAELFGPAVVEVDIQNRRTLYSSEELQEQMNKYLFQETFDLLYGYVDGFNKFITEVRNDSTLLPGEFQALGLTPNWITPQMAVNVTNFMMRQFGASFRYDEQAANLELLQSLLTVHDNDTAWKIYADVVGVYNQTEDVWVSVNHPAPNKCRQERNKYKLKSIGQSNYHREHRKCKKIMRDYGIVFPDEMSYGAVISRKRSESGKPMYWLGPQTVLQAPPTFFECKIESEPFNGYFILFPGGGLFFFNAFAMVRDNQYIQAHGPQVGRLPGRDLAIEPASKAQLKRTETIQVRGAPDVELNIYYSSDTGFVLGFNNDQTINVEKTAFWMKDIIGVNFGAMRLWPRSMKKMVEVYQSPLVNSDLLSGMFMGANGDGDIFIWDLGAWTQTPPDIERTLPMGVMGNRVIDIKEYQVNYPILAINQEDIYINWNDQVYQGQPSYRPRGDYARSYVHRCFFKSQKKFNLADFKSYNEFIGRSSVMDYGASIVPTQSYSSSIYQLVGKKMIEALPKKHRCQAEQRYQNYQGNIEATVKGTLDNYNLVWGEKYDPNWLHFNTWLANFIRAIFGDAFLNTAYQFPMTDLSAPFALNWNFDLNQLLNLVSRLFNKSPNCFHYDWFQGKDISLLLAETYDQATTETINQTFTRPLIEIGYFQAGPFQFLGIPIELGLKPDRSRNRASIFMGAEVGPKKLDLKHVQVVGNDGNLAFVDGALVPTDGFGLSNPLYQTYNMVDDRFEKC